MPKYPKLWLCLLAALTILIGCGSDDDPVSVIDDPGDEPVDGIAPVVAHFEPSEEPLILSVDGYLAVKFSEPMDPATAAGNITLSGGDVTTLVWEEGDTLLEIGHTAWTAGASITLTVGTGLTDVAGNALPRAFTRSFYTATELPTLLDSSAGVDSGAFPTNGRLRFLFSEEMDLLSVYNASTLEVVGGKAAIPEYQVGTVDLDYRYISIRFLQDLDPDTHFRFTIDTSAVARFDDQVHLTETVVLDFTTASGADEAAPYIVSTSPAVGSTAGEDLESITVTFSEPIDATNIQPSRMSAILWLYLAGEPVWNAAGDEITLYLVHALPPGVRIFTWFDDGDFRDLAGNTNATPDSVSFHTPGEAEIYPIDPDVRLYYGEELRVTFDAISGGSFERLVYRKVEDADPELDSRWRMTNGASGLTLNGFETEGDMMTLSPVVDYLPDPVPANWSGSSTGTVGSTTVTLDYSGELLDVGNFRAYFRESKELPWTNYIFEDCVTVYLEHAMTPDGATSPASIGEDTLYYCPGIGLIYMETYEYDYDEDESWEESAGLAAIAWDDRYEH